MKLLLKVVNSAGSSTTWVTEKYPSSVSSESKKSMLPQNGILLGSKIQFCKDDVWFSWQNKEVEPFYTTFSSWGIYYL